jgi:hypothetical protein
MSQQNNNSLLPDGYRFWTDDHSTTRTSDSTDSQNVDFDSASIEALLMAIETQPISVEVGVDQTACSLEERAENVLSFDENSQPISVEIEDEAVNLSEARPDKVLPNDETSQPMSVEAGYLSEQRAAKVLTTDETSQPMSVKAGYLSEQSAEKVLTADEKSQPISVDVSDLSIVDYWLTALGQEQGPRDMSTKNVDSWTSHGKQGWPRAQSSFWECDSSGEVLWFLDQNRMSWTRDSKQKDLYCSEDGGERSAFVSVNSEGCSVEDADGMVLIIKFDGKCSIRNQRKTREPEVRNLLNVFGTVDTNGDERLSLAEIESALVHCAENERSVISSLKMHFKRIEWSRRGMFGQVAEGLSLREILDFMSTGAKHSSDEIDETVLSQFEAVIDFADSDRSGFVTLAGLRSALEGLKMPVRLSRSIEILTKRLNEISLFGPYGFEVSQWQSSRQSVRIMLCDVYNSLLSVERGMPLTLPKIDYEFEQGLFADGSKPLESIKIGAINNLLEANQSFLSVVASLIQHDPEIVLRSIRCTDNGAFVVTFLGEPNTPVRVLLPSQREIAEYRLAPSYGVWALVLARGFSQYVEHNLQNRDLRPQEIARLLSGREVNWLSLKDQCSNELARLIERLWTEGRMTVLCRFPQANQDILQSVLKHSCAITEWEPQSGCISIVNSQSQAFDELAIEKMQASFDVLVHG